MTHVFDSSIILMGNKRGDPMRKVIFTIISLCLTLTLISSASQVQAIDFSGQEDKYIEICSSSSLAKSQESTCKQFNKYLKEKQSELEDEIEESEEEIESLSDDIDEVEAQIEEINSEITSTENEISYLEKSITTIEANIETKEQEMKDRLYEIQDSYNSNVFVQFLFGASTLSDFFSRLSSLNDITAYEQELIAELTEEKEELDQQKETLETAKANLLTKKEEANALQEQLTALKEEQEAAVAEAEEEAEDLSDAQKEINETLAEIAAAVPTGDSGGSVVKGTSGDADTGYAVAQAAVSKIGCAYYWGASGPNYFDCSGLVYWAHKTAGVSISRTTANSYAHSGTAVSYDELQAGDVVCFRRAGASTYHHIAIYIGNGIVVHASGEGSTCLGQHLSLGHMVKRSALSSFSSYSKTYRRLY